MGSIMICRIKKSLEGKTVTDSGLSWEEFVFLPKNLMTCFSRHALDAHIRKRTSSKPDSTTPNSHFVSPYRRFTSPNSATRIASIFLSLTGVRPNQTNLPSPWIRPVKRKSEEAGRRWDCDDEVTSVITDKTTYLQSVHRPAWTHHSSTHTTRRSQRWRSEPICT